MFNRVFKILGIVACIFGLMLFFNVEKIFGVNMTSIEISKMKIMMLILSFNLFLTFSYTIYSSIIVAYEKFFFHVLPRVASPYPVYV